MQLWLRTTELVWTLQSKKVTMVGVLLKVFARLLDIKYSIISLSEYLHVYCYKEMLYTNTISFKVIESVGSTWFLSFALTSSGIVAVDI